MVSCSWCVQSPSDSPTPDRPSLGPRYSRIAPSARPRCRHRRGTAARRQGARPPGRPAAHPERIRHRPRPRASAPRRHSPRRQLRARAGRIHLGPGWWASNGVGRACGRWWHGCGDPRNSMKRKIPIHGSSANPRSQRASKRMNLRRTRNGRQEHAERIFNISGGW